VREPVPEHVLPVRAQRRHAGAELLGGELDREGLHPFLGPELLVHEVPQRDERVLRVAVYVDYLAARRGDDGPRQRHERDVRGEEPWVRKLSEVRDATARVELELQERHALMGPEGVERVVGGVQGGALPGAWCRRGVF